MNEIEDIDDSWHDKDFRQVTRLSLAARAQTLSEVRSLCDKGADVNNQPEWDGWDFGMKVYASPLMEAAVRGNVDIVRELLQRGAKADAFMCDTDPRSSKGWHTEGWTVLMSAVSSTCLDVVELIVAQGVDVNAHAYRSQWVDSKKTFKDRGTVTALELAYALKLDAIAALLAAKAAAEPEPVPPMPSRGISAALAAETAALIAAKRPFEGKTLGEQETPAVPPAATSSQPKRRAEVAATKDTTQLDLPVSKRTRGAAT